MDDQHDMVTSTLTWFHTRIEVSKETPREKKNGLITVIHHWLSSSWHFRSSLGTNPYDLEIAGDHMLFLWEWEKPTPAE